MAEGISKPARTAPRKCGNRYENPWPTWTGLPNLRSIISFRLATRSRNSPAEIESNLPVVVPEFKPTPEDGIMATWLGHATVFLQMDGVNVLTDPILSARCSPFSHVGPKRYRPPPCTFDDLPKVDAVVISHNHYDHLDINAVRQLHARFGEKLRWFVPLGLKRWFQQQGVTTVTEMDWWQEVELQSASSHAVKIVCLPAQHWSLRSGFDRNASLWSGWGVLGHKHKFYFAGDTGYCPEFKNIGANYGPFDLAAIPIGCYNPREFMHCQHVGPAESVMIHKDVNARYSLGIHWGTYDMGATEAQLAPRSDLKEEVDKAGLTGREFFTLYHGETWTLEN